MVEFVIWKKQIVFEVKRSARPKVNNFGGISKILNFHQNDLKFEEDLYFRSLNSEPIIFEINMDQKVNIGQISKIVNFHPIHLKFEEDLYFRALNSINQLFWRSTSAKRSTSDKIPKLTIFIQFT